MDLGFLHNPVNTVITAMTVLAIVGGLLYFLSKRKVSISKDGFKIDNTTIIEGRFLDKIPAIDLERKTRLKMELSSRKDVWLGLMHNIKDKTIRQFLNLKMLSVLETKIDGNHLTATFSDKSEYAAWVDEIEAATKAKMRYIEDYTGTIQHDAEGVSDKEYEELLHSVITEVVSFMRSVMKAVITESCEEKLTFYKEVLQSKPSDDQIVKTKELIERNEGYIKRLAEF